MPRLKKTAESAAFRRSPAELDRICPERHGAGRYPGMELLALARAGALTADEVRLIRAVHAGETSHPLLANPVLVLLLMKELGAHSSSETR